MVTANKFERNGTTLVRCAAGYTGEMVVPEGITTIGADAFANCTKLTGIKLPESLRKIEDRAFERCDSLTSVDIPSGVSSIGVEAFQWCTGLSRVKLPPSLSHIAGWTFSGCSDLPGIYIPETVQSIGQHAFYGCSKLSEVLIPSKVTEIGFCSFARCWSLPGIEVPAGARVERRAFGECEQMRTAVVPETCLVDTDAFPPGCVIYSSHEERRLSLAREIAAGRADIAVEVVGMCTPTATGPVTAQPSRSI